MTVNGIKAENTELRQEVARLDEALATEMRRSANLASEKADYRVQYSKLRDVCRAQEEAITRLTAEVERLRAALEKAEGGFYNMANAIDDYDYHGPAPQCTGDIIGHREQFHRVHVEQLVKYAEECRAALSGDKHE